MKVIIIGYRATGKSTVGLLLSEKLQIPFVDTDQLIEDTAGMPIKALVARHGWETFRKKETEAIASLCDGNLCVVATGGGAILSGVNRELLKNMGTLIYLKTPLPDIVERLKQDAQAEQIRPQFTSGNLIEETIAALEERIPIYESTADFTVDTNGKSIARVSDDIYQHLLEAGIVSDINKTKKIINHLAASCRGMK
jgi:shikimate kinase